MIGFVIPRDNRPSTPLELPVSPIVLALNTAGGDQ